MRGRCAVQHSSIIMMFEHSMQAQALAQAEIHSDIARRGHGVTSVVTESPRADGNRGKKKACEEIRAAGQQD